MKILVLRVGILALALLTLAVGGYGVIGLIALELTIQQGPVPSDCMMQGFMLGVLIETAYLLSRGCSTLRNRLLKHLM